MKKGREEGERRKRGREEWRPTLRGNGGKLWRKVRISEVEEKRRKADLAQKIR